MSPDPTMFWSEDRANDIRGTFSNIISKCKEEEADLLLISGDLFNHQPVTEDLEYVNNLFKTIPRTQVAIIAGSADHIKHSSPILNFDFAENVYYFLDKTDFSFRVLNKTVIVHGFSYYSIEDSTPIINSFNPPDDKNIHILLAYGGDSNHSPFDVNKLIKKNFSYIALGSSHNFEAIVDNKIYYSGSPEPLSSTDAIDHGIIIGEINENTRLVQNIRFEKIAKASYLPINIKINGSNTEEDIVEIVVREVIKLGAQNIFKIKIAGLRNPDLEISREMFSQKIRISDIIDNSTPKYDFVKLSVEHPQDMIGAFIRKMTTSSVELSDIEKRALYLGTHALIKTSEKNE